MTNSQQSTHLESDNRLGSLIGRINASDSFFDTIKSTPESIKDYLEKCIKCLRIGKGTPPEIESAAFIAGQQMLADNLTFAELRMRYHIYPDKLALRSEYIHAEIERLGWSFSWVADGEDGKKAIFSATKNGVTRTVEFTIELAKQKGLFKGDGGWQKDPAQMLRARCITRFATMYIPSIGAGTVDDVDHGESVELDSSQVSTSAISPPLTAPTTTAKQPERQTPPPVVVGQSTPPTPSQSDSMTASKSITLDSMTSTIEFAKRAFTGFAKEPKISTIGQLVKYTREELIDRESMGETTVKNIEVELAKHGFKLKQSPSADKSGGGPAADAESAQPEATTDDAALSARGLELAEDSDANHTDNVHGAAIAEIRQLCSDAKLKEMAKAVMGERCGGKESLADLSALEANVVLMFVLGTSAGVPIDKLDAAYGNVMEDEVPIDRAVANCEKLREKISAKN